MAHAYTPGLRVTDAAVVRRERRLPLKGRVLARAGETVRADQIVARCELPGNVQTVNLASRLALDPARVPGALTLPIGSAVEAGQRIAGSKSLFGLISNHVEAPVRGTIESVSSVTGQLILREPPIPVEVAAYLDGTVCEVLPDEGVVVESRCAFLQGIFGVGGETSGEIVIAVTDPAQDLEPSLLKPEHRGRVVVGGAYVSIAAINRARDLGVAAIVAGGFDDRDLRELLGRDLGVAITGSEEIGLTLVLTEGFGRIRIADRAWRLLGRFAGHKASVSGATQIRAGVMRPEILIPHGESGGAAATGSEKGLEIGSPLRVIRPPYFGRVGRVVELPTELQRLESEAEVRVLEIEFADDGTRAVVPRANVELIAE
ncbi:MAG TPA: hypothetical protein VL123_07590 [Candidatus Udaeobacter sp.]|jgi:hypothetical protein|nr:hypothetical protein [Candidatus Udaeobacter sp.]